MMNQLGHLLTTLTLQATRTVKREKTKQTLVVNSSFDKIQVRDFGTIRLGHVA
jgi:hypothetical protein